MFYKSIRNIAMAGALLTATATAFAATTPKDMTCQEFINLDPQAATPVAMWVLNSYTEYAGGDYVALTEVDTTLTPQIIELCKKHPSEKLVNLKMDILEFAKQPKKS